MDVYYNLSNLLAQLMGSAHLLAGSKDAQMMMGFLTKGNKIVVCFVKASHIHNATSKQALS